MTSSKRVSADLAGARLFVVVAMFLLFLLGLFAGATVTAWTLHVPPPIELLHTDLNTGVPMVTIDGIRNGELVGSIQGDVRLVAGENPVSVQEDGTFAVRDNALLTNKITVTAPEGMHFVASKRGIKYYPVDSASGQGIVPENRVYFPDSAAAEKAGYVR